ncbi:MAG: hypothetical protein WAN12_16585 [Candidatus Acidiferrum sp.]
MAVSLRSDLKVADEVWIATALLHRERPDSADFSIEEIVGRVQQENLYGSLRPGVYTHVVQHCVANRPPNPGRYRILYETTEGRRRLFRKGDPEHSDRRDAKSTPAGKDLPDTYTGLLTWYEDWCALEASRAIESDPLISLVGSGRHIWAEEHADGYVDRLRASWK